MCILRSQKFVLNPPSSNALNGWLVEHIVDFIKCEFIDLSMLTTATPIKVDLVYGQSLIWYPENGTRGQGTITNSKTRYRIIACDSSIQQSILTQARVATFDKFDNKLGLPRHERSKIIWIFNTFFVNLSTYKNCASKHIFLGFFLNVKRSYGVNYGNECDVDRPRELTSVRIDTNLWIDRLRL